MESALKTVSQYLGASESTLYPWHELRSPEIRDLRATLINKVSAGHLAQSTANKYLAAVRGVLRAAQREGHMPDAAAEGALQAAENLPNASTTKKSRLVSWEALSAFFLRCELDMRRTDVRPFSYRRGRRADRLRGHHLHGARDAALLALGYGCGIKPGEARALRLHDVAPAAEQITVSSTRSRTLYLPDGARQALQAWMDVRPEGPPEHLFIGLSKYGTPIDQLTQQGLNEIMRRRQCNDPFSFQDLRRTFRARLNESGVRRVVVRALLGLRLRSAPPDASEMRQAIQHVSVPFNTTKYDTRAV